ncbi:hypothetical protein [Pantoea sp. Tr-811]|uniref:hypothetical protein n=1 Tax=Pantoea sp. Tr-811 TaxID=2608361 RepID=UPI00196458A8|nr:hypothetical protein [Pantoea sp. Tr-811]
MASTPTHFKYQCRICQKEHLQLVLQEAPEKTPVPRCCGRDRDMAFKGHHSPTLQVASQSLAVLRKAGDFPNKSIVEYATIKVEIPHRLVPSNLRDEFYEDDDLVKGLTVSPTGRLSYKTLYLDSAELAQKLATRVAELFKNRPYRDHYKLEVSVERTTMTVTATKGKIKHSALVASYLAQQ